MSPSKANGRHAAVDPAGHKISSAFASFVAEIADLARSVDPALGVLLTGQSAAPSKRWDGGDRRGLELCLKMLRYARDEVARGDEGKRLDRCIEHVVARLDRLEEPPPRPAQRH